MNLKFKKIKNAKAGNDHIVYFNNLNIGTAMGNWYDKGSQFLINFKLDILSTSKNYKIEDFFKEDIGAFIVPIDFKKIPSLGWNETGLNEIWFDKENTISLFLLPDLIKWNKTLDFLSFLNKLKIALIPYGFSVEFKDNKDLMQDGVGISTDLQTEKNINDEYERFLFILNSEIKNLFENLNLLDTNSIVNKFHFPQEIRQACEQYLVYFSKFLEDYGIEITTTLEVKNNDTFFSVKPKNSNEALSNIRDLLELYLSLPNISNLEDFTKDYNDISVKQLLANIYHLKSQLILTNSIIEMKDTTIDTLKINNIQKQDYIEKNISKNEEKILDGLLTIKEFEYKCININLPEVFRRLKRKFTK
ncbi:hypothetical protein BAX96_01410 [Elizabethkingia anophelis]|uniref:hypothetical protein n=1 Tax=Elizabethkingia anophelis TaxID=1117645 RepID=UPI000999EC80|nr:hypothetical protein [Elizabethkingia anophelis]MCT3755270.1 hypothetical protein [Elizabethkingia anophelis]MCT4072369.1 hypothetical protein [Elizabethkingia anophelis]MCT4250401.1 hypothetical protein [Elizabethkingia anophelis]MCT4265600.1 hypothetical protein [Elizabethkingia anophelis]MCT4269208.1 hypothetical protein [Elizabethkingia anophelis]